MIIGITGTIGAGKGTIVNCLKKKGFHHFSVREFLNEVIRKRNLEINRDNMVLIANELRKNHHPSYIVEKLYSLAKEKEGNSIIESIRNVGEVEKLKEKENFYLISVDADMNLRYKRIIQRGNETDNRTFEEFAADEEREITTKEVHKINLKECINRSDFKLTNNETIEELENQVEEVLRKISD
jgi:dephospho-CoA kinase